MKLTRGLLAGGIALTLALAGCGSKEQGTPTASGDTNTGSGSSVKLFSSANELVAAATDQSKTKKTAKLTFDMSASGQKMTGDGAFRQDASGAAMRMSMEVPGTGAIEMVLLDQALYVKAPQLAGSLPAGKEWIKVTAGGTDPMSKAMAPMFKQMEDNADVTASLEKIKAAGEITKSAEETLDGQQVTHYWIALDVNKLAAQAQDDTTKKAMETLGKQGVTKIDQELWLNSENLPIKVVSNIPMGSATAAVTVTFKDWGQPVEITAPADDKVATPPGN